MSFFKTKNVNFNYELYGSGEETIVFISGYISDKELWRSVADALQNTYKVLVFDNQGTGQTEDNNVELTVASMAANIHDLVEGLGIEKPIIAGFALASCIAQSYADQFPGDVSKLILLCATMKWQPTGLALATELLTMREENKPEDFFYGRLYDMIFGKEFQPGYSKVQFIEDMQAKRALEQQSITDQKRQLAAFTTFDSHEWAHEITVPSLVVITEEEQFVSIDESQALAKQLPNSEEILINCGHSAITEQFELLMQKITGFLAQDA